MSVTLFISHSSEEADLAAALKKRIHRDFIGIVEVFVSSDIQSIAVGEQWLVAVQQALTRAALVVVLASRTSVTRPWVNYEAGAAWMAGKPILPVCHSGCTANELPMPFKLFQAVELDSSGIQALYRRIVATLQSSGVPAAMPVVPIDTLSDDLVQAHGGSHDWDGGSKIEAACKRLKGAWRGSANELPVDSPLVGRQRRSYSVSLDIFASPSGPHGRMAWTWESLTGEHRKPLVYALRVLMYTGDYIALEYRLDVPEASHFGVAALAVYGTGARMVGFHVARELDEGGFVFGDFGVQKS